MTWNGKKLIEARESKGLTQEELGAMVGVEAASVSRWENNVHVPSAKKKAKIAEALGRPIDFFQETENRSYLEERLKELESQFQIHKESTEKWVNDQIDKETRIQSSMESDLIRIFRLLSKEGKDIVLDFTKTTFRTHPATVNSLKSK